MKNIKTDKITFEGRVYKTDGYNMWRDNELLDMTVPVMNIPKGRVYQRAERRKVIYFNGYWYAKVF
jgi:hypothetical protein